MWEVWEDGEESDRHLKKMSEKEKGKKYFRTHEDLAIYQLAMKSAMQIFEYSKKFPREEKYALTDQIRRSSRSVCANKRRGLEKTPI